MEYRDLLGKPFKWGGYGPDAYFCWGLIVEVFRRAGISIRDLASQPEDLSAEECERFELAAKDEWIPVPGSYQPYDVFVFDMDGFDVCRHCGVMTQDRRILQALKNRGVVVLPLWKQKSLIRQVYRHKCLA